MELALRENPRIGKHPLKRLTVAPQNLEFALAMRDGGTNAMAALDAALRVALVGISESDAIGV